MRSYELKSSEGWQWMQVKCLKRGSWKLKLKFSKESPWSRWMKDWSWKYRCIATGCHVFGPNHRSSRWAGFLRMIGFRIRQRSSVRTPDWSTWAGQILKWIFLSWWLLACLHRNIEDVIDFRWKKLHLKWEMSWSQKIELCNHGSNFCQCAKGIQLSLLSLVFGVESGLARRNMYVACQDFTSGKATWLHKYMKSYWRRGTRVR